MAYKIIGTFLLLLATMPSMAEVISVNILTEKVDLLRDCENVDIFYKECHVDYSYSFQIDPAIDSYFLEIGDAKVRVDGQMTQTGSEFRAKYDDQIFPLGEEEEVSSWVFDYGPLGSEKKQLEILSMGEGRAPFKQSASAYIQSISIELNRDFLLNEKDELQASIDDLDRLIQMGQDIKKFIAVNNLLQSLAYDNESELSQSAIEESKANIISLMMKVSDLSGDVSEMLIKVYSFVDNIKLGHDIRISQSDRQLIDEFNILVSSYDSDEELVSQIENDRQKKMTFESQLSKIESFLEANP